MSLFISLHLFPLFVLLVGRLRLPLFLPSRHWQRTVRPPPLLSLLQCRPYHPPRSFPVRPLLWGHYCHFVRRVLSPGPGFEVGPGHSTIPPELVGQIRIKEYVEFTELLPDSLPDNEVPRELLLKSRQVLPSSAGLLPVSSRRTP